MRRATKRRLCRVAGACALAALSAEVVYLHARLLELDREGVIQREREEGVLGAMAMVLEDDLAVRRELKEARGR